MFCQHPSDIALGTRPLNFNTHGLCTSIAKGNTLCRDCFISTTRVCERSGPYSRKIRHPCWHQRNCLFLKWCRHNLSVASAAATAFYSSCPTGRNQHCRIMRLVLVRLLLSTTPCEYQRDLELSDGSCLSEVRRMSTAQCR